MTGPVELYTADGILSGGRREPAALRAALEGGERIGMEAAEWLPLRDGVAPPAAVSLTGDEVLVAVDGDDPEGVVHASLHDVVLDVGPYRISGSLPVLPGFDPGRALARPGTTFLAVRHATLVIREQPTAGSVEREEVLVNRYVVERVASDLVLAFFFPAARFETLEGIPVS